MKTLVQRKALSDCLPLDLPFSLHVFPSYYCNFKCQYCLQSLTDEKLEKMGFIKQLMDFEVYKKVIDELVEYNWKLKALIFAGHGEPLMHPDIDKMVAYARDKDVSERIEIVTNGYLLTEEMSDRLINAGLDRLRISLQGINEIKYKIVSDVNINFDLFLNKIKYFYQHKQNTEVCIKIIDVALDKKEDELIFREMFGPISDNLLLEYMIPFVREINYEDVGEVVGCTKQGGRHRSNICSMPFYMLVLSPEGNILPCCSVDIPIVLGNIKNNSLKEIWESDKRRKFLINQLKGYQNINVCNGCSVPWFGLQEGDFLDEEKDQLLLKYMQYEE